MDKKWERLVEARKNKGITQKEMADYCQVAVSTVVRWEALTFQPSINQLKTLSTLLGVSVDWLISNDDLAIADEKYWFVLDEAKTLIGKQIADPESFLSKNKDKLFVEHDYRHTDLKDWLEDKMAVKHGYFSRNPLDEYADEIATGTKTESEEAVDDPFPATTFSDDGK